MFFVPLLVILPLAGSFATILVGRTLRTARVLALAVSLVETALATILLWTFFARSGNPLTGPFVPYTTPGGLGRPTDLQLFFVEKYDWAPGFGLSFLFGVDGLSVPLVFLTPLLTTIGILFSWTKDVRPGLFFGFLLFLEFSLTGVFVALDLFLFFVFWELVLIPMFFLIGIWGGPNRQYASIKFLIYTHVGSVIMLLSIFALYFYASSALNKLAYYPTAPASFVAPNTFDMTAFLAGAINGQTSGVIRLATQIPIFVALFIGFGVKLPMVPFHTWLPDAHVEAPTAGSVILAGLLLKMGGYGLFRIGFGMLPQAAADLWWLLAVFGVVSMLYASFVCLVQIDLKRLIAYSSVGHMGFVLLGASTLVPIGIAGGIFQLFNHGLITAVLFMLAGTVKHVTGTRDIPALRGLGPRMPKFSFVLVVGFLASVGIPSMNSFWSEFMVFVGTYGGANYEPVRAIVLIPLLTIILTAAYYLWTLHRIVLGDYNEALGEVHDLNRHEIVSYGVLLALIFAVGIFPTPLVGMILDYATRLAAVVGGA